MLNSFKETDRSEHFEGLQTLDISLMVERLQLHLVDCSINHFPEVLMLLKCDVMITLQKITYPSSPISSGKEPPFLIFTFHVYLVKTIRISARSVCHASQTSFSTSLGNCACSSPK